MLANQGGVFGPGSGSYTVGSSADPGNNNNTNNTSGVVANYNSTGDSYTSGYYDLLKEIADMNNRYKTIT